MIRPKLLRLWRLPEVYPSPPPVACHPPCVGTQVLPLKHRSEVKGPFPIAEEPSDHVLLAAEYKMDRPAAEEA